MQSTAGLPESQQLRGKGDELSVPSSSVDALASICVVNLVCEPSQWEGEGKQARRLWGKSCLKSSTLLGEGQFQILKTNKQAKALGIAADEPTRRFMYWLWTIPQALDLQISIRSLNDASSSPCN